MNKKETLLKELEQAFLMVADLSRAKDQQRYMKSQMPYFGVILPGVRKISNIIFKNYIPKDNQEYREVLLYLFEQATHREVWYAAEIYASKHKTFIVQENIDVYIKIIRISRWWDIVDAFAANIIGRAIIEDKNIHVFANKWICDDDMWVRRVALLFQLKYKDKTDFDLLSKLVLSVAHEREFFIRKAIGWALREYSKTNAQVVKIFIETHSDKLSGLSIREGLKVVNKIGQVF